jgi:hypothetical protein
VTFAVCLFAMIAKRTRVVSEELRSAQYVMRASVLVVVLFLLLLNAATVETLCAGPIPFASLAMFVIRRANLFTKLETQETMTT